MGPWQPLNGEIYRQTEKMMYLPLIRYKKLRTIDGTLHTTIMSVLSSEVISGTIKKTCI
jgi:hypothetical protein